MKKRITLEALLKSTKTEYTAATSEGDQEKAAELKEKIEQVEQLLKKAETCGVLIND